MAGLLPVGVNAITVTVLDRGWWKSDFSNNASATTPGNTFTGLGATGEVRSYFVFDLSGLTTTITGGTLDLDLEAHFGDGSETIFLSPRS